MASAASYLESPSPSFLFDLDGTLIDSVYQHVIAWRTALMRIGIELSVWRIHRRIGMSGGLFVTALLRETGRSLSKEDIDALQQAHAAEYRAQMDSVTALPGARELLAAPRAGPTHCRQPPSRTGGPRQARPPRPGTGPGRAWRAGPGPW